MCTLQLIYSKVYKPSIRSTCYYYAIWYYLLVRCGLYFVIWDLVKHLRSPNILNSILSKNTEDRCQTQFIPERKSAEWTWSRVNLWNNLGFSLYIVLLVVKNEKCGLSFFSFSLLFLFYFQFIFIFFYL